MRHDTTITDSDRGSGLDAGNRMRRRCGADRGRTDIGLQRAGRFRCEGEHRWRQALVDHVNRQGGVHGQPIKLVSLDDRFDPARTVENAKVLIS